MKKLMNPRLLSAAEFVRQGARFADIGTDHAYLPIFLLSEGKISFAVCSDINEGPLASAVANAKEEGLEDRMAFTLADGADELEEYDVSDIAICGMGGELISNIIERAKFLRDDRIRLILQPMTKQEMLRERLYKMGYEIEAESYSTDAGKHYVCMCAKYTGVEKELSAKEIEICPENAEIVNKDIQKHYINKKISVYEKIIRGKMLGGEDYSEAEAMRRMLLSYLAENERAEI
jgi:tRNA (adenine22-N1)-methyltransferase